MRWQKKARLAIAAFIVVFAAIVFVRLRHPSPPAPSQDASAPDPEPLVHTLGRNEAHRFTLSGKPISIVSLDQKTYADGRNVLLQVTVTFPDRDGRPVTVTADELEGAAPKQGSSVPATAQLRKHVKLTTSDGLTVTADEASYDAAEEFFKVPGPVTFARGRLSGKGIGATYDQKRDVLWLQEQAQISVAPDETGGGRIEASAGTAGLARAEHYVRMSKAAHIVSDARTIDADDVTATLTPDDQRVQVMQLRGNSRIVGQGANSQSMSAKDIDLTYAADGRTLQHALLMEQAVAKLAGDAKTPGREISARTIELGMAPDGTTLTQLNATDKVTVELPAQGDLPAKTIHASSLAASGQGDAGLQTATFEGPIDFREVRAARGSQAAIDRHATARRLIVHTKPGFGDVEQAEFLGNVKFVEGGGMTAEAPRALYQVDRNRVDLSPSPTEPGPTPTVTDGQMTVNAKAIEMSMETRSLKADTDVRSNLQRKPANGRGDTSGRSNSDSRLPSMLKPDQNVTITSNRMEYDGSASRARYMGAARLTQGSTEIRADTIDLDEKTGNLTARVKVRTTMMLEDVDPKTKQRSLTQTVGTGETFVYDDAKRLATYTSSATVRAHLVGPQGDLTGDRIDLYLKEGGNELERLEADGNAVAVETNRTAVGAHLTYTAADDTYVMIGTPVEVVQKQTSSCKKTQAATVRFQRAVDNITTEGKPVTTTNIACPGSNP
jgi:lipopolysaccharide transport protein LptA